MKTRLILFSFLFFAFLSVNGQKNQTELVSATDSETILTFKVSSYDLKIVNTQNGEEVVVNAEDAFPILMNGAPNLPKFTESIIIPDMAKMEVEVISSNFIEIDDINVAPSKGNLTRDIDPASVPYEYGKVYQKNDFFPNKLADLDKPYIVRDYRGQALHVYPFQYNPVTKKLRIYTEITVKVSETKHEGVNVFNRTKLFDKVDNEFNKIYSNHFINYEYQTKYTPVEEEGRMLIICYDEWTDAMQALVDWKNTIGRSCEMVPLSTAGSNANDIKAFVENYYNEPEGLTYLLLIGDAAQVPTNSGSGLGGHSDNAYAYITGDDHYLEFFVGRFSAESLTDVETQVLRTIEYENGSELTSGWLNRTMGVGSDQGPGDDNEYDYEHIRNMQIDLTDFTYAEPTIELFDGSQGGNDASGNPTPAMVSAELETGTGMALYTGHGSDFAWSSSGFSVTQLNSITNENMLPFVWTVACVNGAFVGQTCFGEAWLRATNGDEPTGGIACFAATINQSWAPPMIAQDEMVDLLVGTAATGTKRTYGGISVNGCFQMNDESGDFAMTDTWTIFGDPSLLVRTDDPSEMNITHNDVIIIGESEFTVNCDLDNALVCISKDGEIIGTEYITEGTANVPLSNITPGENLTIAVTGFNKITYLTEIMVISPEGPYMVVDFISIDGGTSINYGQTKNIDICLKNVGTETAIGVTATINQSDDEYVVSFTNNENISFGDITENNGTAISSESFTLTLADNVPDGHVISFDVIISDGSKEIWDGQINVTANAPVFEITAMNLTNDENGNGRLDPGETAELTFTTNNIGHADTEISTAFVSGDSPYLDIENNSLPITIAAGASTEVTYNISANEVAAQGTLVNLSYNITQVEYTADFEGSIVIGQPPEIVVGEGDDISEQYPFYTYYKNNKTQMLYYGSEIGAGENLIQEMAFDFVELGGMDLPNLVIKFKETDLTELGSSYADMSDATTVMELTTFTMPEETGWFNFDIDDYTFDGTENNLLVEIDWGQLENWESNYYKVNCTQTEQITVAYGYDDNNQHPSYSGNNNKRPNIMFFVEGEASGDEYPVNFTVADESGNPINEATVTVGVMNNTVNEDGETNFTLIEGDYSYTACAFGYISIVNDFNVVGETDIVITLIFGSVNELSDNVKIYPNPSSGIFTLNAPEFDNEINVKIFNITGALIYENTSNDDLLNIDMTMQAKGLYLIEITSGEEVYNSKIIIK